MLELVLIPIDIPEYKVGSDVGRVFPERSLQPLLGNLKLLLNGKPVSNRGLNPPHTQRKGKKAFKRSTRRGVDRDPRHGMKEGDHETNR